mmetsp:Transcript_22570/g.49370  ORF Transcript_22570/g.49370 Transcript_22570/m.49370 type:complete len:227 (-) Transcript_22570:479-1159(-)
MSAPYTIKPVTLKLPVPVTPYTSTPGRAAPVRASKHTHGALVSHAAGPHAPRMGLALSMRGSTWPMTALSLTISRWYCTLACVMYFCRLSSCSSAITRLASAFISRRSSSAWVLLLKSLTVCCTLAASVRLPPPGPPVLRSLSSSARVVASSADSWKRSLSPRRVWSCAAMSAFSCSSFSLVGPPAPAAFFMRSSSLRSFSFSNLSISGMSTYLSLSNWCSRGSWE